MPDLFSSNPTELLVDHDPRSSNGSHLVLVVDDDAAIGRLIAVALGYSGIRVQIAAGGHEGLVMARLEQPDLVILDLKMPIMDGRGFYRAFREEGMSAPVMILSADGAQKAQIQLGAQAFLDKPFRVDDLEGQVEQLLPPRRHG